MWGTNRSRYPGYQGQHRRSGSARSFNARPGYRAEFIDVPANACGLIVGKGGRNVKELQQMEGIEHIRVDFQRGSVKIVGNDAGIAAARHRIDQAVVLAVNSDGYFPNATLTCLMLTSHLAIRFRRVSKANEYVVRTEQLDGNRQYFLLDSVDEDLAARMDALALTKSDDRYPDNADFVAGFEPSKYMSFFDGSIRKNLSELSDDSVSTSIGVNFGKTFLSSVPEGKQQGQTLMLRELINIGYGKHGLRPEFVRNFNTDKHTPFLSSIGEEGYEEISSGNFIVVHCVSQKTKKRYKIKLHLKDDTVGAGEPFPEVESFKSVGRKHALCTVLRAAAESEFRTTIETAKDEAIDQAMLRKLQSAWDERSDDGKMRFGTDDWLVVETVRYKKRTAFTNGVFVLAVDEATEDHFGKSFDGIHVSLESYDIADTLDALPNSVDKDGAASRLLSFIRDLQGEAANISSLLGQA